MQGHAAVHVCEGLVDVGSGRTDAAWHGYMVCFYNMCKAAVQVLHAVASLVQ